jgi:hypothetical protein
VSSFLGLPKTLLHFYAGYLRVSKLEGDYQNRSSRIFKSLRRGNRAFTECSRKKIALLHPDLRTDELSETYLEGFHLMIRRYVSGLCLLLVHVSGLVYVNGWLLGRESRMKHEKGMEALGAWAGSIAWDGSIIGFWGY